VRARRACIRLNACAARRTFGRPGFGERGASDVLPELVRRGGKDGEGARGQTHRVERDRDHHQKPPREVDKNAGRGTGWTDGFGSEGEREPLAIGHLHRHDRVLRRTPPSGIGDCNDRMALAQAHRHLRRDIRR
jgi:hypothetical protein